VIRAPKDINVFKNLWHFLAFGFGSGKMPFAPGTFGTIAGVPIYLLMQDLGLTSYLVVVLVMFIFGVWICQVTSDALGVEDHGGIVWDEIVGYLITMTFAPKGWIWVLVGFLAFRLFDIWKPWPIKQLEKRFPGGLGVMVDDVLAAVYALILLQLIVILFSTQLV